MTHRAGPRLARCALAVALAATLLCGCSSTGDDDAAEVTPPPAGAAPDYQLGGAYEPDPAVGIVARDRTSDPDPERYSICYVNGFQTQPGERGLWPDGVVLTSDGTDVVDPDWPDEALLDTSTAARRATIATTVGPWIRGCADDGFDAVEFDNLDSYTRSGGALTLDDNLALATTLVGIAHAEGLAAGQKNAAEATERLHDEAGFDFAVVEECMAYDECDSYTEAYGDRVIAIEYPDELPRPFAEMCADPHAPASLVLRDRDLTVPGDPAHRFELCDP
ncbi:Glycoside-hydrolase family GH114 [Agromyces sp. CF514]|uniref:endo alpha-1,4 polygalactosaminidase n=1 Tax=Agromyces sp. CF514 TaxID=1881031 RepID=UPI0008DF723B|nr:endo alpha-1,4 polygalactosaminidase [Agromyces sp. CF514]SFR79407.1 Glycoside-hydrolase family GH114 [Agromyces sp. CF514]